MVQTAESPPQTEPNDPTSPVNGIEDTSGLNDQTEARYVSRAEQKRLFYKHLSQRVLDAAGIESEYIDTDAPEADTNQFFRPRGFLQRRAAKRVEGFVKEIDRTNAYLNQNERTRTVLDHAKSPRVKKHNYAPVKEFDIEHKAENLKKDFKAGRLDPLKIRSVRQAKKSAGHASSAHHGSNASVLTDEERLRPTPAIRSRQDLDAYFKHDKLVGKAQRLAARIKDKGDRSFPTYEARRDAKRINHAWLHPQVPDTLPPKVYFETPAHSPVRLRAVGARAFGREVLADLAGRSASRAERNADFYGKLADNAEERLENGDSEVAPVPKGLRERAKARLVEARVNSARRATKQPKRHSRRIERADRAISKLRASAQDKLPSRVSAKRSDQEKYRLEARSHRSRQSKLANETSKVDITGWGPDIEAVQPVLSEAEIHTLEDTLDYYQDELSHHRVGSPEYDDVQARINSIEKSLEKYNLDSEEYEMSEEADQEEQDMDNKAYAVPDDYERPKYMLPMELKSLRAKLSSTSLDDPEYETIIDRIDEVQRLLKAE